MFACLATRRACVNIFSTKNYAQLSDIKYALEFFLQNRYTVNLFTSHTNQQTLHRIINESNKQDEFFNVTIGTLTCGAQSFARGSPVQVTEIVADNDDCWFIRTKATKNTNPLHAVLKLGQTPPYFACLHAISTLDHTLASIDIVGNVEEHPELVKDVVLEAVLGDTFMD